MSLRTCLFGPALFALAIAPACAHREMRAQAAVLAEAGARLEREAAEFSAARSAVVQLRQRNLVERRQQTAEQGQFNARTIHYWKIASDPERSRRLSLYDGLVAASAAAAQVQERPLEWEESILARSNALTIDRAALHRFVQQLLLLSSQPRFLDNARFFAEYGAVVGAQVEAGLQDVQATVAGAASASAGSSGPSAGGATRPPTGPNEPAVPPVRPPPDTTPTDTGPPELTRPPRRRDPP